MAKLAVVVVVVVLLALAQVLLASAFAEEHLDFRDPATGNLVANEEISTFHFDLTYALALSAGFSESDARAIQVWDQLVDSVIVGEEASPLYSNLGGTFPAEPGVCPGPAHLVQAWPMWGRVEARTDPAAITSRYGPYMPFFHFPHENAEELGALHDWGWGIADNLVGYQAYAWGSLSAMEADCYYKSGPTVIDTTMAAGSLEAFATYLHSLGDAHSHAACIAKLDDMRAAGQVDIPWSTHTIAAVNDIYECNFNPESPNDGDAHGREFGTAYPADSARTNEALLDVYAELALRSERLEGDYWPLPLTTPLVLDYGETTLAEALDRFVHGWLWSDPGPRRDHVDDMVAAILAARVPVQRTYVPLVAMR
ncbi:MAG: hypothetical protein ACYC5O_06665 [Anaerolineae bacterium]